MNEVNNKESETIGSQVGDEAFNHAECNGEEYRIHERQRIDTANQPKVLALMAVLGMLEEDEEHLQQRIHAAPQSGNVLGYRRRPHDCGVCVLDADV